MESHFQCKLKNHTVVYIIACMLSSCRTDEYNVDLLIILERGCNSMYRKKERKKERVNFAQFFDYWILQFRSFGSDL